MIGKIDNEGYLYIERAGKMKKQVCKESIAISNDGNFFLQEVVGIGVLIFMKG